MSDHDDELLARVESRVGALLCNKYRVERVLGVGGMATVYAATHRNGRAVALKMLHPELSVRKDIRTRFLREGQAANAVKHPGAVAVIDDDVAEDGAAFLVMERLEGLTLERLWEEAGQRLPERIVLAAARELCSILDAAHQAGIVHRDIKPENLFLTNDGTLKVLDFGLAQLRDAARPKDTHTGMVFGTPAFMPPEQASGRISQIDARTDIWAVGATMFTLLSGRMVHEGESAQHFVMLAATEPARSLRSVLPTAAPELVEIVDRALSRQKGTRWASADAMRKAICAASQSLFDEAEPAIPRPAEMARPRPHPAAVASEPPTQVKPIYEIDPRARLDSVTQQKAANAGRHHPQIAALGGDSSAPPTQPERATPARLLEEDDDTATTDVRGPAVASEVLDARYVETREDLDAERGEGRVPPAPAVVRSDADTGPTRRRLADTVRRLPAPQHGATVDDEARGLSKLAFLRRARAAFGFAIGLAGLGFLTFAVVHRAEPGPPPAMRAEITAGPTDNVAAPPSVASTPVEEASTTPVSPAIDTPPPAKKSVSPTRAASPPPPTKAKRNCAPPYELEANGHKRWKMECL